MIIQPGGSMTNASVVKALFYGLKSLTPKVAVAWSLKEEQHQQLPGGPSSHNAAARVEVKFNAK